MANFRPVVVDPHAAGPFAQLQDGDSLTIGDNEKLLMGDAQDAAIYYTGSNLVIDSREVGLGDITFRGILKPLSSHTSFSLLDDDRTISTEPTDGTNQIIDAFPTLSWSDSGNSFNPYFGCDIGFRDDRTYVGTLLASTELQNYGARFGVFRSSSFTGSINAYNLVGMAGNFIDQGVYDESTSTLKTVTWTYSPWELSANFSPTVDIGAANSGTYNGHAMEIDLTTAPTLTSGNLAYNVRGVSVTSTGTTVGTSVGYAFYADLAGYDTSWAFYNATASPNFLGLDNSKTYWGTGQDASMYYDGTNLVIDSQEVGSGAVVVNSGGGSLCIGTSTVTGTKFNVVSASNEIPIYVESPSLYSTSNFMVRMLNTASNRPGGILMESQDTTLVGGASESSAIEVRVGVSGTKVFGVTWSNGAIFTAGTLTLQSGGGTSALNIGESGTGRLVHLDVSARDAGVYFEDLTDGHTYTLGIGNDRGGAGQTAAFDGFGLTAAGDFGSNTVWWARLTNNFLGVGTQSPASRLHVAGDVSISNPDEGNVGRLTYRTAQEAVTLSGASTDSTINIPAGAVLLGVSFNVNTAVTDDGGDDTWSAAFTGGSSTSLASGEAAAQNTKVDTLVVPEVASAQTNVRFTPNGGSFTAGVIEIVAYYYNLTSLDDV